MGYIKLARELEGIQTVETLENKMKINRAKAIYLIYRLRKSGYVKTKYTQNKKRVYYISPKNALGGTSYLEIINKYSPIKIAEDSIYRVYGREIKAEEAIVYAIKKKKVRFIIACLSLFRKVRDWPTLYKLAKNENIIRETAILYDIARLYLPKIPKMTKRFKNLATPKKTDKYKFIINGFKSKDFLELEKKWKVYVPLNKADLIDYKI